MIEATGERLFKTIAERDAFIDENFPKRTFAYGGSVPGLYKLPGRRRFLSVFQLRVSWGKDEGGD